jgi:hypothetical protein
MTFFSNLVIINLNGISTFVERLVNGHGHINFQYLHKVTEDAGHIQVKKCDPSEKNNNYGILLGGEVPNSFCPLYEVSYFIQSLLLAGVGTAVLKKHDFFLGKQTISYDKVEKLVSELTEKEIEDGISNPTINIICSLDTDIEPYRYVKHHLWRIEKSSQKKRCSEIKNTEIGVEELDNTLKGIYWIDEDAEIAEISIGNSHSLTQAKAIQYYLTMKKVLDRLGLDIKNIRWYFNFSPNEEIIELGAENKFIEVLSSLHQKQDLSMISHLTGSSKAWIFSFACPNCGESSKRVINANVKNNSRTTHLVCSKVPKEFRNELGSKETRVGCGYAWNVYIPEDPIELYQLLKSSSFTINFLVRELMKVMRTSSDCPICCVATDIGIKRAHNNYELVAGLPKGYGDHRLLITSMLAMQKLFIEGHIAKDISIKLREERLLESREIQFLAWAGKAKLYDQILIPESNVDIKVTDTSILKLLEQGINAQDLWSWAVDINEFTLDGLLHLKNMSYDMLVQR